LFIFENFRKRGSRSAWISGEDEADTAAFPENNLDKIINIYD
jgi:hypothetical protein